MAVTFPLNLPSTPELRSIDVGYRSYVGISQSIFGPATQLYDFQAAVWEWRVEVPKMKRAEAEDWAGFFISLQGPVGSFLLGDPLGTTARGVATGTPVVSGAHAVGVTTLATSGWTATQTGIMKAGDWLQLGNGVTSRLHRMMQDADSDGGGLATLEIFPPIKDALVGAESITVSSCKGVFRLVSTRFSYNVDFHQTYGFDFEAIEVA